MEELSGTVALYDRNQQQSQDIIQNLKEELAKAVAQSRVAAIYSTIGKFYIYSSGGMCLYELLLHTDEESNHDVSSLLSTVGRSFAMIASANQRSQESVPDPALEINRLLSKHSLDVHKRCVQDIADVKQVCRVSYLYDVKSSLR